METIAPSTKPCRATARAWLLAAISPALIVAGIWRVDGTLGALGIAGFALLLLARWLGSANLRHLSLSIEAPQRATVGAPYPLRITLNNRRRWLDARHVHIHAALPGASEVEFTSDWLPAASASHFETHATPRTRADGACVLMALRSDFPFRLFEHQQETQHPHAMIVLPRPRAPRNELADGMRVDGTPLAGATAGSLGGDLRGLRTWRAGDRPRQIAWPASLRAIARGAAPVVCENDPPGFLPNRCVLVIHSFASGGELIRPERFERALEHACGWIEHLHHHGIRTTLIADFDRWTARDLTTRADITRCREAFARARRWTKSEAHELQEAILRHSDDGESLILLSDMPAESWQHHLPRRSPAPVIPNF